MRATEHQRAAIRAASAGQQVTADQELRLAAREAHGAVLQAKVETQDAQIQKTHAELQAANIEAATSFDRQKTAIIQSSEATDSRLKELERHAEHNLTLQAAREAKEVEVAREAEAARQQAAMYKYTLGKVVDDVREKFGKKRAAVGGAEDVESGEHVRSRTPYGQAGASGGATGDEDP